MNRIFPLACFLKKREKDGAGWRKREAATRTSSVFTPSLTSSMRVSNPGLGEPNREESLLAPVPGRGALPSPVCGQLSNQTSTSACISSASWRSTRFQAVKLDIHHLETFNSPVCLAYISRLCLILGDLSHGKCAAAPTVPASLASTALSPAPPPPRAALTGVSVLLPFRSHF